MRRRTVLNEFPFQQWSAAGHVMTRNPVKFAAAGDTLTMWAAPDNGDEGVGTQIYTWRATVGRPGRWKTTTRGPGGVLGSRTSPGRSRPVATTLPVRGSTTR
jgi:hypothetical protein